MGKIHKPQPTKLIIGLIFQNEKILYSALLKLKRHFGEIDFESKTLTFELTDYYKTELGDNLKRKFVSFKKLIQPNKIAKIKVITNKIEEKFSKNKQRSINIDPGYIDLPKLILASTKDFAHRIYLNHGIFAEVTLTFHGKTFQSLPHTFPDYRTIEYIEIFNQIRTIYLQQQHDR